MKKLVIAALAALCVFAVSCGNQSNKKDNVNNDAVNELVKDIEANSQGGIVGYTGNAGDALKTLDDKNFASIVKTIFGVDVKTPDGFKVYSAKSPNKVNNAELLFTKEGAIDEEAIKKNLVEQLLKVTEDGLYTLDLDFDTLKMTKGDKIESFDDFKAKAAGKTLYYVFGGKGIQAACSANSKPEGTSTVSYNFTLTTVN